MHGAHNTCQKCMHTLRKKCIWTRACAPMQRRRSFFAMEGISNLSWVLRKHRASCRGRLPSCRLDPTDALLLARPDWRWLPSCLLDPTDVVRFKNPSKSTLAHDVVSLWCCTSIIWSSALVQASSSLSMGRARTWPSEATRHRNAFSPFSRKNSRRVLSQFRTLVSNCVDVCLTWYLWHVKVWWWYPHHQWQHQPSTLSYPTCCVYLLCQFFKNMMMMSPHKSIMTIPTSTLWTPPWYMNRLTVCNYCACFAKNVIMKCQQFSWIRYVSQVSVISFVELAGSPRSLPTK